MGVESGIAHVKGGDVVSYLPDWVKGLDALQPDSGLDACQARSEALFPRSLLSAGLDHIANNLLADLDKHLQCWPGWLIGFKALANLLSRKYLLTRLVANCINDTPHQALRGMFNSCVENIAKWRWGTIANTLPQVLRLQGALRIVWGQGRFLGQGGSLADPGDGDGPFDVSVVTRTIQDARWWATGSMLLELRFVGQRLPMP